MPPFEDREGYVITPIGRVTFRVTHDAYGNPVVPRGTPLVLADGTVVGVAADNHALPSGPRNVSISAGAPLGRWDQLSGMESLRIGTVGVMMTGLIVRTIAIGGGAMPPPFVPQPPRWVPLTVDSGRKGLLRLLRARQVSIPKSAMERLLDDEELA